MTSGLGLFFLSIFFGLFAFNGQVSRDRQETGSREGGMTCRIRPLGAGFEPASPPARTVASTHGAGALPAELCSTPGSLLFADDVVLLTSSDCDLQLSLHRFAAECKAAGMRINTSKSESMVQLEDGSKICDLSASLIKSLNLQGNLSKVLQQVHLFTK